MAGLTDVICCLALLTLPVEGWFFKDEDDSIYCKSVDHTFKKDSEFGDLPLPDCFNTHFRLQKSGQTDVPISEDNIAQTAFDSSEKTFFLIHGYNDNIDDKFDDLASALHQMDASANIIAVDWSEGATRSIFGGYDDAAANCRVAARAVHNLFKALVNSGLERTKGHCIGHSLGAHVCGLAGQHNMPFGRISGIDPAGPEFEGLSANARLSASDADFVDVIHTDGGGSYAFDYGSLIPMGDMDFYANGGMSQPGCVFNKKRQLMQETAVMKSALKKSMRTRRGAVVDFIDIACSHTQAFFIYVESINSKKCVADKYYSSATEYELTECSSNCPTVKPVAGYHSYDFKSNPGMYGFSTKSSKPYC